MTKTSECYFTGEKVDIDTQSGIDIYEVNIFGVIIGIGVCLSCLDNFIEFPKHIIKGFILNNRWPKKGYFISDKCTKSNGVRYHEEIVFNDFISTLNYPKTPIDKFNSFLFYLFKLQKKDGDIISLNFGTSELAFKNYFVDEFECKFYLKALKSDGLIDFHSSDSPEHETDIIITLKGLNYIVSLQSAGNNSQYCFIAMSFDEKTMKIRSAIKNALKRTGYKEIIIDETNVNSDKTIPDAILSAIRQSKFCIADFTMHKSGVYFESGYALGLGKNVIYTCLKEDFPESHFDIKQLQHIIYETTQELEDALVYKIEAWI